ncbi:hypothetical protein C1646_207202 [Rhizophagus diaphanus]|nr:hypothetical protein C1646_207202 [Rhizophagus diaphanus] [Rhizophagus sp. MUCL 43196]
MKILPKSARETKSAFFGKKGWALHSILVYMRKSESHQLDIQVFDHWSADTCQDAWFTASSLHAVIESLQVKPDWVTFLSDNGPHYHNADLMLILGHWNEWYNITVKKWVFLETGEAKTSIDSHHAQISHAINRYVRLGFDINEESGRKKKNSIPGNSNWYEWSWPTEEINTNRLTIEELKKQLKEYGVDTDTC